MKKGIINFAIKQPWIVIGIAVVITAFFAAQFPDIKIDTDPENMLAEDAPVRVFEHEMKETFGLSAFLAVGIVHEPTAFTPDILNRIYRITADIEEFFMKPGVAMNYEYDFGDSWEHLVVVEKVLPAEAGVRYPVCLAGKRACPPEDVGGIWGYADFLETIQDPKHPAEGRDGGLFRLEGQARALDAGSVRIGRSVDPE